MTTAELIQYVSIKLGEQTAFYTQDEIVKNGLNPAQRLLCLAHPRVLNQRAVFTIGAERPFVDLRLVQNSNGDIVGNRVRKINRVVLGDVSDDVELPSSTTGELRRLRSTTLTALITEKNWLKQRGEVRRYWQWGKVWLGVYKRPVVDTTVTLIYESMPTPLSIDNPDVSPDVQDVYHTVIAETAVGLLITKEGAPDGVRGVQKVMQALQIQQTTGVTA
jgi:hypothetical protein